MTPIRITCPMVPPSHNVLRRKYRNPHVYAQLRDDWQRTIYALVGRQKRKLYDAAANFTKMRVEVELRHKGVYDEDNLYSSLKPILDSLVRLRFVEDDSMRCLGLRVSQKKSPDNETEIVISEAVQQDAKAIREGKRQA